MQWIYGIPHKARIAVVLAVIMMIVTLSNVLVRRDIDNIDRSFTSIYNDRLMPATAFFYITESLYNRRLALEKSVFAQGQDEDELKEILSTHDAKIDSLIREFEKTYLVRNEASLLRGFKKQKAAYNEIEARVIALSYSSDQQGAIDLFENEGINCFSAMLKDLHHLIVIQAAVGKELLADSHHTVASANMISFLEAGVAIVLGLLVYIILLTSKAIHRHDNSPFHLN